MKDLRRQALESNKTVSRKARSRLTSRTVSRTQSPHASRSNSRAPSRNVSDDEDGNLSDETVWSVNSIDEVLSPDNGEFQTDAWIEDLKDRIEQILDRKRSSVQGREDTLMAYNRILIAKYAQEVIHGRTDELVAGFLKSIKAETSEKETILALKALILTIVTEPSETVYDIVYKPLNRVINDSESVPSKVAAVHALGVATFYGGASVDETQSNMGLLLEIIESDGHSAGAGDSGNVVTSALEEWGFLATQLEDISEETEVAMEAFIEQLDSVDPSVQIASGENIALAFEKSYTPQEDDEDVSPSPSSDLDPIDEDSDEPRSDGPRLIKRYDAYRRTDQLKHQLASLASISSRRLSKKDKKSLHTNFADILNSVENPTRGPRYQNALNHETGRHYGSRMNVRIHRTGVMKIDKWWKLHRLQALRRILGGGFVTHYESNEVVFDSLPIMISNDK
ncbi:MAG: hypothetical protein M1833_005146 [Piccolia ochrophora]|nr:MAG: hypothetical protein M1833_005146 [Piccolia ochrophora]